MAARIAGVNLPENKRVAVALTYIYGIGHAKAKSILEKVKIENLRVKELSEEQVNLLRNEIEKGNKVEGDLRREVLGNIKRLKDVKCYRGIRHIRHLPARGQRTKTNCRTVRGNIRKTMGSGKRKLTKT
jgi:small subunit ribosomal protein S13